MSLKTAVNPNAVVASVSFKLDNKTLAEIPQRAREGLFAMGYDIAAQARRNAPVVTSALRNSIRVEAEAYDVYIRAGGTVVWDGKKNKRIDYAMKREQGPNRNPATEHYMENAKRMIMTGDYMQKYFGGTIK